MGAWVLLLHGVGGPTQIDVRLFRATLKAEGFDAVKVTGMAGNAVFLSPLPEEAVAARAADGCEREMGFRRGLHLLSASDFVALVAANPFPDAAAPSQLHLGLLAGDPEPERVAALRRLSDDVDELAIQGNAAYLHLPRGWKESRMADRFIRGIGVPATVRSWTTVLQLLPLAEAALAAEPA